MNLSLRTDEKRGTNLRGAGSEDECRSNSSLVSDASGRDHRNFHGIDYGRQKREQSNLLALGLGCIERAAMAASLHALHNDHVGASLFRGAGFTHGRDVGKP